jgi:hypothetical protein
LLTAPLSSGIIDVGVCEDAFSQTNLSAALVDMAWVRSLEQLPRRWFFNEQLGELLLHPLKIVIGDEFAVQGGGAVNFCREEGVIQ